MAADQTVTLPSPTTRSISLSHPGVLHKQRRARGAIQKTKTKFSSAYLVNLCVHRRNGSERRIGRGRGKRAGYRSIREIAEASCRWFVRTFVAKDDRGAPLYWRVWRRCAAAARAAAAVSRRRPRGGGRGGAAVRQATVVAAVRARPVAPLTCEGRDTREGESCRCTRRGGAWPLRCHRSRLGTTQHTNTHCIGVTSRRTPTEPSVAGRMCYFRAFIRHMKG